MTTFDSLDAALAEPSPPLSADRPGRPERQVPEGRVTGGVVVTIKRRRVGRSGTRPDLDADPDASAAQSKAPRVFRLASADPGVDSPAAGVDETAADRRVGAIGPSEAPAAEPTVRRKRPRDPVRAPGKVTSIVFPAASARQPANPGADRPTNHFMGAADAAGYARVMADLEAVRDILDAASRARDFRVV